MNVAPLYAALWAALAAGLWRAGDRPAASVLAAQAAGCAVLWPIVGVHPFWPVIGATIFLAAALHQHMLADGGKISWSIPCLGYALACSYVLHVVGGVPSALASVGLTPTWLTAALGIAIAAIAAGPTARRVTGSLITRLNRRSALGVGASDGR